MADEMTDSKTVGISVPRPMSSVNNEEIISELTKDISDCSLRNGDNSSTEGTGDNKKSTHVPLPDNDIPEDFDKSDDEETDSSTKKEDDFIDEDCMKDAEVTYTEDDKERLRLEADVHKSKGNDFFKSGEYRESASFYTLGLRTCPLAYDKERSILYCNRAAAKMKLSLNKTAIEDCTKAIELNPSYLKAYFRRAQMYEETDKLDEALADYAKILELDPSHKEANIACRTLPQKIEIRNEKMKTEMLGKLKDLGNMILRPFGLSTNNFQLNQDPSGKGYSVNFQQNAS